MAEPATAECFVCAKHRQGDAAEGGVLYEDDLFYAGHVHTMGRGSAYRGWLVVEPKRHVGGLGDLTDDEAASLGRLVNRLARVPKATVGADHVYAFVYGDAVAHLHVHLAPRYRGTPPEYGVPDSTRGRTLLRLIHGRCANSSTSFGNTSRPTDADAPGTDAMRGRGLRSR